MEDAVLDEASTTRGVVLFVGLVDDCTQLVRIWDKGADAIGGIATRV